jgi:hypothetical protein
MAEKERYGGTPQWYSSRVPWQLHHTDGSKGNWVHLNSLVMSASHSLGRLPNFLNPLLDLECAH